MIQTGVTTNRSAPVTIRRNRSQAIRRFFEIVFVMRLNVVLTSHLRRNLKNAHPCARAGSSRHQRYTCASAEDARHTTDHQGRKCSGQQGSQAEAGQIVTTRRSKGCRASYKNGHRCHMCKSAQRVTENHHGPRIGYLATGDRLCEMVVREDLSQYYSLAQQAGRNWYIARLQAEEIGKRIETPTQN